MKWFIELVINFGIRVFNKFIAPFKQLNNNETLRRENIESFLEHKSVSEYLNYASCATDAQGNSVYLLKDGRFGIVLAASLPSFPGDAVENQIRSFLKGVNEEIDIVTFNTFASQNIDKQLKGFLDSHPCQVNIKERGFLKKLIHRRYEFLRKAAKESLYDRVDFKLRNYVSTLAIIFNETITEEDCFMRIESLKGAMGQFHLTSLPPEMFVSLQREFFFSNEDASFWNDSTDSYTSLDRQITRGGLKVNVADKDHKHGFVINDATYVSVMTTKKFPATLDFDDMDSLFMDRLGLSTQPNIRGPFFTSLVLDYRDNKKIRKEAMQKVQANFNETVKHSTKQLKKRPELKKRKIESEMVIELLDSGRDRPVPGKWTLVMWDDDTKKLSQSISAIQNAFSHKGWEIIPETFGHVAFLSALHSLPLQLNIVIDEFLKRKPILFESSNHCPIVPWLGETPGPTNNPHIPWFARTGQLQWWDPFDSDVGSNIASSGTTGSGKSYTVNDILVLSLARNTMVRVIDSLASYKKTALSLGGQYEEFTDSGFCMNFFTNIMLKKDDVTGEVLYYVSESGSRHPHISDEDYSTIVPLVGSMMNLNLSSTKSESTTSDAIKESYISSVIEEAIRVSFEARGHEAGMKEVYQHVIKKHLEEKELGNDSQASDLRNAEKSLARFGSETGPFFKNFNGVNNIDISSDLYVSELQALESKGILYPLALMSIANKISTEFFDLNQRTRDKILAIDEFWKYIDVDVVLNFSVELARKVRKAGGLLMVITQGLDDWFANPKMKAIFDNCAWQFILKNKPVSIDNAIYSKKLSVGNAAASMLKGITPKGGMYGEFCLMEGSNLQFSRLRVDGVSHYLFSSSSGDESKIQKESKRLGIGYLDAILYLGIKRDEPEWDDARILVEIGVAEPEALEAQKELALIKEQDIDEALRKTLELSNFVIEDRFIYNQHNETVLNILRFGIKSSKHELFYFDDYASKMRDIELDSELTTQMFEKAILPEYDRMNIGILLTLDTLINNKFFLYVKERWKPGRFNNLSFVIDVSIENFVEFDEISPMLSNWREMGFKIHIKRYNYLVDNSLALEINPAFTVIDAEPFGKGEDEDNGLSNLVNFAKVFSDDVVLINSQRISPFTLSSVGIEYKDSQHGEEILDDMEQPAEMERIDVFEEEE